MQDRRTVLKVIGATTAALPALAQQEHAAHDDTATPAVKYTAKAFNKGELALLAYETAVAIVGAAFVQVLSAP